MGYRTRYALRTVNPADDAHIRASILKHHAIASPFCVDTCWNDDTGCKWYDSNEDCTKVSADNPDVKFTIYGHGKGHDDDDDGVWARHYDGGACVWLEVPLDEIRAMMEGDIELRESRA